MKKFISTLAVILAFAALLNAAVIQKGPITIEGKNARTRVTLEDLNLTLDYQEQIDLGKYFTQEQILMSVDLHKAIDFGLINVYYTGTDPDVVVGDVELSTTTTSQINPIATVKENTSVTAVGGSLTLALSSSTVRLNALVQNANDKEFLYIGNYPTGAGDPLNYVRDNGIRIDPGSYYETTCRDELYVVTETGKTVNVRIDVEY